MFYKSIQRQVNFVAIYLHVYLSMVFIAVAVCFQTMFCHVRYKNHEKSKKNKDLVAIIKAHIEEEEEGFIEEGGGVIEGEEANEEEEEEESAAPQK